MNGKRIHFGFGIGIIGLGAMVAIALTHLGHDALAPVAMFAAAFGGAYLSARTYFHIVAEGLPVHLGPVMVYGHLAHRLDLGAKRILRLISASLFAAGVGLLAMLPIGARMGARPDRAWLALG